MPPSRDPRVVNFKVCGITDVGGDNRPVDARGVNEAPQRTRIPGCAPGQGLST